jgi:uncharacterized protein YndB with AHSA1/START domain
VARNRITIAAPPDAVYAVLLDPACYERWVVGAKEIRGVDAAWPREGARFHHTVGAGQARVRDSSKLVEAVPGRRLVLEVRFRPVGVAHVVLDLERRRRATRVTMTEYPVSGPAHWLWSRPLDVLTRVRNRIALRRLRHLVESR